MVHREEIRVCIETSSGTDVFVHSDSIKGHDFLIHGESVVMQVMVDPSQGEEKYRARVCLRVADH